MRSSRFPWHWFESKGGRVSSVPATASSSIAIYGPREIPDNFGGFKRDVLDRVIAKIDKLHRESKVKLGITKEVYLESVYCCCLGLLDPATNIRINASIFRYAAAAAADSSTSVQGQGADMAKRSLHGLLTFLACLFPCLPYGEALTYLDAVDADPMAAAALIATRRGAKSSAQYSSSFTNAAAAAGGTMEMALRCAAVAAKHPDPSLLVKGWRIVSPRLIELDRRLSLPGGGDADDFVRRLLGRSLPSSPHVEIGGAWSLASARLGQRRRRRCCSLLGSVLFTDRRPQLPPVRAVMKRMLLARIHGFYLQALRSLPTNHHRAMVTGGYCFGPLHPAANIIVNTVRHEQSFPSLKQLESDSDQTTMISTKLLSRIAARSLYGLVTFLCARYPSLSPDHAMQRLLVADVSLQAADPDLLLSLTPTNLIENIPNKLLDWSGCPRIGSSGEEGTEVKFQERAVRKAAVSVTEAYAAAATAAFHPSPPALQEFLGSPASVTKLQAVEDVLCLDDGHQLSDAEFRALCMILLYCPPSSSGVGNGNGNGMASQLQQEPTEADKAEFRSQYIRVKTMVVAALDKFNRDNKSQYCLHVICGANELVSGPELCSREDIESNPTGYNPSFPCKYLHCHINFLATCLGEKLHDDQPTKLFFAECSLDGDDSWCAPVDSSPDAGQARCFYCEKDGNKIIHPACPCFHGSDFQEAFFGSQSDLYRSDGLAYSLEWMHGVEEDAIYNKNWKHQVRDDGDAGNGLKPVKLEPLDGDAVKLLESLAFSIS